jgi:hypothetical protein
VAIDSMVQRRPPEARSTAEDAACEKLAQLMLAYNDIAQATLAQILGSSPCALQALKLGGSEVAALFQAGFRDCLDRVINIKVS